MTIKVSIEADDAADLKAQLASLGFTYTADKAPARNGQSEVEREQKEAGPAKSEPEPEQPSEASGGKPTKYRGKNAEKVRDRLVENVKNGVGIDQGEYDKLPEKHQQVVYQAIQDRYNAANATPSGATEKPDVDAAAGAQQAEPEGEPEPAAEPANDGDAEQIASEDDARKALKTLLNNTDMDTCRSLLAEYGATKVTELPEGKRAGFIKACNEKAGA